MKVFASPIIWQIFLVLSAKVNNPSADPNTAYSYLWNHWKALEFPINFMKKFKATKLRAIIPAKIIN